jgi:gas vesicle protein
MNSNECSHPDNKFWLGFFLGGFLGAIVLFFIGTKEGKKAQKLIKNKAEDVASDIESKIDEFKEKGQDLVEQGEKLKADVLETLEGKKEVTTEHIAEKIDSTLAHIEAVQERGRQATANIRKMFKNLPKKS